MCYYNSQKVNHSESIRLQQLERAAADFDFLNYELQVGFDYANNAVLIPTADHHHFTIVQMEWGFLPAFLHNREAVQRFRLGYTDAAGRYHHPITTLNAVGEEMLLPGKMYREAALQTRCLVLSTGFYEWRHVHPLGKKGQPLKTAIKYPYFITVADQPYFFMAGIYQPWTDKNTGEQVDSFAIITTKANDLMAQVHNSKKRMPLILDDGLAYEWLLGDPDEERIGKIVSTVFPAQQMRAVPIAKNFRELEHPSTPVVYPELPPLDAVAGGAFGQTTLF